MKPRYILFFLLAIVCLTGCQKNHTVSIPTPDVQQNLFDRMAMKQDQVDILLATSEAINIARNVTLNNIANFKTTGFKKQRVHIQDGRLVETSRIWNQGNYRSTGNALDMVIEGEGFFQIVQPNGEMAYTRDGNLHLDRDGNIVTSNGDMLDPQISIPVDQVSITIGSEGSVSVKMDGKSQAQTIGRIELVRFHNPSGLKAIGRNLFVVTHPSGDPVWGDPGDSGMGRIQQGFLEDSNVNMLEERMQLRILQSWEKSVDQALMSIYE